MRLDCEDEGTQDFLQHEELHIQQHSVTSLNPFPVQFKLLVPGQKSRVFHGTFKFTYYTRNALERLEGEGTFKSRALWSVREGKGLRLNL